MANPPDAVLESIDGALRDYGMSADAMRWTPDPAAVTPGRPALFRQQFHGELVDEESISRAAEAVTAFCDSITVAITVSVAPFMKALGLAAARAGGHMVAMAHTLLAAQDPRHRVRCPVCNPAGNPPPFPGGAEYHRRRKARARRKRR